MHINHVQAETAEPLDLPLCIGEMLCQCYFTSIQAHFMELTAAFVSQWNISHPEGKVLVRDLNATALSPITAEWVGAVYTPEDARSSQQKELLLFGHRYCTRKKATSRQSWISCEVMKDDLFPNTHLRLFIFEDDHLLSSNMGC